MRALDITRQRYGFLVAIERVSLPGAVGGIRWKFKCDCGNETIKRIDSVRRGHTQSCDCRSSRRIIGERSTTHGHSAARTRSRTLAAYKNAKSRCFNKNVGKYPAYGGRGITMCTRWKSSFSAFLADMGECPPGLTLERKDVNKNYEPGNCIWADWNTQHNNKRNTVYITYKGKRIPLKQFCRETKLSWARINRLLHKGMSSEEAFALVRQYPKYSKRYAYINTGVT
jgi:hypothetical protein